MTPGKPGGGPEKPWLHRLQRARSLKWLILNLSGLGL